MSRPNWRLADGTKPTRRELEREAVYDFALVSPRYELRAELDADDDDEERNEPPPVDPRQIPLFGGDP